MIKCRLKTAHLFLKNIEAGQNPFLRLSDRMRVGSENAAVHGQNELGMRVLVPVAPPAGKSPAFSSRLT
jgi:hypothetical protein